MKVAVSACLTGINCKYNGKNNKQDELCQWLAHHSYITVCPEVTGGLPTPRVASEIVGDRVINKAQVDVTKEFIEGAKVELENVLKEEVDCVILQPRSPSCGKGEIYDGSFQGKLVFGDGIFVQMLKKHGISVYTCEEFVETYIRNQK